MAIGRARLTAVSEDSFVNNLVVRLVSQILQRAVVQVGIEQVHRSVDKDNVPSARMVRTNTSGDVEIPGMMLRIVLTFGAW